MALDQRRQRRAVRQCIAAQECGDGRSGGEDVVARGGGVHAMQHVVVTGRAAPPELLAVADTVTEMQAVKHAFAAGIAAQPGVEW